MAAIKKNESKKESNLSKKDEPIHEGSSKDFCFIIMPFGGWFDTYYEAVYIPAIENAGLVPKRADNLYRPSIIVNDIWTYTKEAKLVLADLTGRNPNVFYELGLAHALAKPAILITNSMEDVPFDLRALRVLEYDKNSPNWGNILKEKITNSIKEVLGSPLKAVLPAFLDVRPEEKQKPVSKQEKEMLEIRHEIDLLKEVIKRPKFQSERDVSKKVPPNYIALY